MNKDLVSRLISKACQELDLGVNELIEGRNKSAEMNLETAIVYLRDAIARMRQDHMN